jgi:hypothetical protein
MSRKAYLLVAASIFAGVCLLHLARIVFGWSVVIGDWSVPMWVSWVGALVSGALAWFGFSFAGLSLRRRTLI